MKSYRIVVVGMGYVGLSNAVLLAQHHQVTLVDIIKEKVEQVNNKKSPIKDEYIEKYFAEKELRLNATQDPQEAYRDADFIIIAVPTNYDSGKNYFDISVLETVIRTISSCNLDAVVVIKSTVPVGFTATARKKYNMKYLLFSPEFLREGKALYDNLYPSRIIIGMDQNNERLVEMAYIFVSLLQQGAKKKSIPVLYMNSTEAEAVKLFANTYLALRVSYFNELDTYAEMNGLDAKAIIDGVCLDPRIGDHYNNPSFGYGGYCLPKDTKQLLANYANVPENLIRAIVESNETRKKYIADQVLRQVGEFQKKIRIGSKESEQLEFTIGVYRLVMKNDSDNFRQSAILDVIRQIQGHGFYVIIYEPILKGRSTFLNCIVTNDLYEFKQKSNLIIANRIDAKLNDVREKIYSRDLFSRD